MHVQHLWVNSPWDYYVILPGGKIVQGGGGFQIKIKGGMDGKKVTLKHVKTSPYTFTIFIDKETLHMFKSVIIFSQDKVGKKMVVAGWQSHNKT